ncbi:MAG: RNA pseudouridine synthase [Alphaproteobacteria bacterium]|nr:RNA pseudouridine synthase [Alphaproteobacteria bacterium]
MEPDFLLSRLLYRDGLILIIDKPAGLPVHAGPKGGDNLERYFDALRFGFPKPPSLAHRLDRDTSGCLVLGRHPKALRRVGKLFQDGRVEKTYWAVLRGVPAEAEGVIDKPLKKVTTDPRSWWMQTTAADDPEGMATVTGYKVLGTAEGLSWVAFFPKTGRTHQIRVHAASLGCPVLGDPVYGNEEDKKRAVPMHLHARAVSLPLYPNKEPVSAEAPPPEHMFKALQTCGCNPELSKPFA